MLKSRSVAAVLLMALLVAAACAAPDPVEELKRSRFSHEVKLISMNTWDRGEITLDAEAAGDGLGEAPADGSVDASGDDPNDVAAPAEAAEPTEGVDLAQAPDGASEDGPEEVAVPEAEGTTLGILSLRVTERNSPLVLDCLTIDVLFLGDSTEHPEELGRERVVLEIEGLNEVGGSLEISRRFNLPPGTASVEVNLTSVSDEELLTLCEAKAIAASSP